MEGEPPFAFTGILIRFFGVPDFKNLDFNIRMKKNRTLQNPDVKHCIMYALIDMKCVVIHN